MAKLKLSESVAEYGAMVLTAYSSAILIVMEKLPVTVGMPIISALLALILFNANPAGKLGEE